MQRYYGPNSTLPSRNCFCVESYWAELQEQAGETCLLHLGVTLTPLAVGHLASMGQAFTSKHGHVALYSTRAIASVSTWQGCLAGLIAPCLTVSYSAQL